MCGFVAQGIPKNMCGIAGYAGNFLPGLMHRMNAAQAYRGPDGQGVFEDPYAGVALGHVRLSILDLSSAAAQPMYAPDGRGVLVFNGEIYNFQELRQDLISRGYVFLSTGDTEILLYGLREYGAEFITRLNGIFAFAWWDASTRELLLARDTRWASSRSTMPNPPPDNCCSPAKLKPCCNTPNFPANPISLPCSNISPIATPLVIAPPSKLSSAHRPGAGCAGGLVSHLPSTATGKPRLTKNRFMTARPRSPLCDNNYIARLKGKW